MPNVDPTIRFWIGLVVTIAVAISQGTLVLTNVVPAELIPYFTAWFGVIAFVGSALMTALNGAATTTQSRALSAANDMDVARVVMKDKATADAIPSDKVVDK